MLVLGLLLMLVSAAVAVILIVYNGGGETQTVSAFGQDLTDTTMMQAFVAGLIVAAVFVFGLWLLAAAGRRGRVNRARYREARREAREATAERDDLAERVQRDERLAADEPTMYQGYPSAPPVDPAAGGTGGSAAVDPATGSRHAAPPGEQRPITNLPPGRSPQ